MSAIEIMSKVWVFQQSTLESALKDWVSEQIAAYPHKEELIKTVALAMLDFMNSSQAESHKMIMRHDSPNARGD